jgi:hypothetical protein
MELDLEGVAVAFVETELERLEKELKSLHSQLPPFSSSDEIRLLSVLKAVLGEDDDASSHNGDNRSGWEMFDLVPPTLDAFARNSKWRNSLDRYTSGLLLQLKLRFFILIKDFTINNKSSATTTTTDEGQEEEDIDGGTPTSSAAAASSDEDAKSSAHVDIKDLMPSEYEQSEGQRDEFIKAKHTAAKELTESKFKLLLEQSNVSTEKEADYLQRFRRLLQRRLAKLLFPGEDEKTKLFEETRKRPHHLNREEEEEESLKALTNKGRMDKNIQREMYRLVREYDRLMKQYLAASSLSLPSSVPPVPPPTVSLSHSSSVPAPAPHMVEDPPRPRTVTIALHLGWNYTHVGWIPPNKTSVELLFPPIPCIIGMNKDEPEVLYGVQMYEALRETLPLSEKAETESGTQETVSFSWLNLKYMLRDKEVEWRQGKAKVKSELPLAIFLIHVKTKIEAAILPLFTNYKVIMVLPQALSIVQRGRISDASELAGFGEDQVHLIKETTAAALAFAHDTTIWSPGFLLPILVCCPTCPPPYVAIGSNANYENNADVAIFSDEDGILTMEGSAGRQGLGLIGVLKEMTKFKKRMFCIEGVINKKSVFVHLDDGNYEEEMPCTRPDEMQEFQALLVQLRAVESIENMSASGNYLLNKIREHFRKYTVVVRFYSLASNSYDNLRRSVVFQSDLLCLERWGTLLFP